MENTLSKETLTMLEASSDKILWSGRSQKFSFSHPGAKKAVIIRWILCFTLFVLLSAIFTFATINTDAFNPLVIIILFIVFCVISILPFTDRNLIVKQCKYYITDKRIIFQRDGCGDVILARKDINTTVYPERNGCISIAFGSYAKLKESKLFSRAMNSDIEISGGINIGVIFFNVENSTTLQELLK